MSRSRYIEIRPDNLDSNGEVSFKQGFPQVSFTIQSQEALLNMRSIRINGDLQIYRDNASPPNPVKAADAPNIITMDPRLGVYAMFEQLTLRHNKTKSPVETIKHYNKFMSSYLGATHSSEDLMGHLQETALINPNSRTMLEQVVQSAAGAAAGSARKNSFSVHLPSGFLMGNTDGLNLMDTAFGGLQLELNMTPDSNCLFVQSGVVDATNSEAHYVFSNLSLTAEVMEPDPSQLPALRSQTSGAISYNTINTLYTTINTSNAQLQFNLGMKELQSVFMTFTPSIHINTLSENGLATTYMSNSGAGKLLAPFDRVQFLRGGMKFPADFDMVPNSTKAQNQNLTGANNSWTFNNSDSQLTRQFMEAIIPEFMAERTSISPENMVRDYTMDNTNFAQRYKTILDGGSMLGLGMRYSQFNGQDFSSSQWGCSIDSKLTTDSPQSVFLFFKGRNTLVYNSSGVQIIS